MTARILDPERTTLEDLVSELRYTLVRLRLHPAGAALVSRFEALLADAQQAFLQEMALRATLYEAEVALGWRDENIDIVVRTIAATILKIVANDRRDPLYQRYFGNQSPSEVTRPVLGKELETVRGWIESLAASPHDELKQLANLLEERVTAADVAIEAQRDRRQQLDDFRLLGPRQRIFERANAERKEAYGVLSKMPYSEPTFVQGPGRQETGDFGQRFFRAQRRRDNEPPDIDEAREALERARKTVTEAETALKAAEDRARTEAAEKAQRAADKEELDRAKKAAAEAARKVADLEERLNKR
jgi:hypothetical protein